VESDKWKVKSSKLRSEPMCVINKRGIRGLIENQELRIRN